MKKLPTLVKIIIPIFIMFICTNVNAITITVDTTKSGTTDPGSYLVTNQGKIKISNTNETFYAYKIVDTYYNSITNEITYEFTETFIKFAEEEYGYIPSIDEYFLLTSGDINSGSTQTDSTLDKVISKYAIYIKKNNIKETTKTTYSTQPVEAAAGAYLIMPKYTYSIFSVMVGNLTFEAEGSNWVLNNAEIVAKSTSAGGNIWIENFDHNRKTIIIGKEFDFISELWVPNYPTNALDKFFIVENVFDEGITFQGINKLAMTIGEDEYTPDEAGVIMDENGNSIATISFIDQVLTMNFNTDYTYSNQVIVKYKAKLNNDAKLGSKGNSVNQSINFATDPYVGENSSKNQDAAAIVYTYDLAILKYDVDEESKLLNGAVFEIYTDEELTDLVGTITTGTLEEGAGLFHGLAQGTYYIKEKKAPSGYKLIRDVIVYELDAEQFEGNLQPISLTEGELPEGTFLLEIPNEKISFLPVTGGIGTIIYTLTGLIIVGGAFYYIKIYKKKKLIININM